MIPTSFQALHDEILCEFVCYCDSHAVDLTVLNSGEIDTEVEEWFVDMWLTQRPKSRVCVENVVARSRELRKSFGSLVAATIGYM